MTDLYLSPPVLDPLDGYPAPVTAIMQQVAHETGVSVAAMRGEHRGNRRVIRARHDAMQRAVLDHCYSASRVALAFRRDSSTVRAVVRKRSG